MMQPALAEHIAALRRYARALLGDRIDADDLVQDCLARALSRAHLWRPGTDLRAWLFTILHNIHINNLRSRRAHVAANEDLSYGRTARAMAALPDQDARLELRDLERALDRIPDEQRQVLLLVGMEGMSYDEAARVVGVPIGTIMSRVARGRDALRRSMMFAEPSLDSAGDGRARHLRRVK
ncbi:MAG TPA: sigma-70 family RNA polymerase sigma factor [Stellaceae bacterium]